MDAARSTLLDDLFQRQGEILQVICPEHKSLIARVIIIYIYLLVQHIKKSIFKYNYV